MKKDRIEDMYGELKEFSQEPPRELWDNIEARLHPKEMKRRVFWWFWGAAAVIAVSLGYIISISNYSETDNKISDVEQTIEVDSTDHLYDFNNSVKEEVVKGDIENDALNEEITEPYLNSQDIQDNAENKKTSAIAEKPEKEQINYKNYKRNRINKNDASKKNKDYAQAIDNASDSLFLKHKDLLVKEKNRAVLTDNQNPLVKYKDSLQKVRDKTMIDLTEELIASNKNKEDTADAKALEFSKWSVEVLGGVSNTTSESFVRSSSVNTSSLNDFVYGIKIGYSVSDKLVIKSGIGKNILGQQINDIGYINTDETLSLGGLSGIENLVNNETILFVGSQNAITNETLSFDGEISNGRLKQRFDYIQVPLELSYNVIRKSKYNLALGIGGHINFLTTNKALLDGNDIGESIGANSTVLGGVINSNVSFKFTKEMNFFLEPSYNYFQKPINNRNQDFNNTQLRILFGLQYRF